GGTSLVGIRESGVSRAVWPAHPAGNRLAKTRTRLHARALHRSPRTWSDRLSRLGECAGGHRSHARHDARTGVSPTRASISIRGVLAHRRLNGYTGAVEVCLYIR